MTSKITNICINQGLLCTRFPYIQIGAKLMILVFIFIYLTIFLFINCNIIYSVGKLGFGEMTSLQSNPERDPYSQCTPR